ncbi:MAG TPA: cation:proton antiporter [Thermoanaerobaculia bacterium]|nr:cation:proton antiporter [Thermoanaerobaculia bacterium]
MHDLSLTLLQIVVITIAARLMAMLLLRLGQPAVVGEIAAGIALGPSLFGAIAPAAFGALFPANSIAALMTLSQIGLILFMFLVGLEFAPELLRERKHVVVVISHVSINVPFILGTALAIYLYPRVAPAGVPFRTFVLFLGTAMSITAFPVLARILEDRNLTKTKLGNTAIACAAVDDITAWCILAFVIVLARAGDTTQFAMRLALVAVYVVLMLRVVRPLVRRGVTLTIALILVFVSAWITELLGIHALFGAFLAGAIMPRHLTAPLAKHVRGVTGVVFLPLFFAITGLRTNVGWLASPQLWICCALLLIVAIVGKFGGAAASAGLCGFAWRDSLAIGALMNTRGLMEMVVVNVGLEIGVVSPSLYTMIVLMALVTTAMTTPILERLRASSPRGLDAFGEKRSLRESQIDPRPSPPSA